MCNLFHVIVCKKRKMGSFLSSNSFCLICGKDFHNGDCYNGKLAITIGSLDPKEILVIVDQKATVEQLKKAIQDSEGIPMDQQRLFWRPLNRDIDNTETLQHLGIDNLSTNDHWCCKRPALQLYLKLNKSN